MRHHDHTVLITGANSGLGFEAAAQFAEAGYGRVILACRTLEKAEAARQKLVERVGVDPFEGLAIDVSDIARSRAAADILIRKDQRIDVLLLNAGLVPGDDIQHSVDGLELSFAASVVGHHVLTMRLLDAGLLEHSRVILVGSEVANNDMPGFLGMAPYDFAVGTPTVFGETLHDAMEAYVRGAKPDAYDGTRYYATAKVFSAWWSGAMARRFGDRLSVFTVGPGSNLSTNAARHVTGVKKFLFTTVMPTLGPLLGWDQPVADGARRYFDVAHDIGGPYVNGRTYSSAPRKMVGPLHEAAYPHLQDETHQDAAWALLEELTRDAHVAEVA